MRRRATTAELQERVDRRCALVSAMGALRRLLAEEPADALARLGRAAVEHPEATRRAILGALREIDATLPPPWDDSAQPPLAQGRVMAIEAPPGPRWRAGRRKRLDDSASSAFLGAAGLFAGTRGWGGFP